MNPDTTHPGNHLLTFMMITISHQTKTNPPTADAISRESGITRYAWKYLIPPLFRESPSKRYKQTTG